MLLERSIYLCIINNVRVNRSEEDGIALFFFYSTATLHLLYVAALLFLTESLKNEAIRELVHHVS